MNVIPLPASLDCRTLDDILDEATRAGEGRSLLDARHVRFVDPCGMVGLLAAATYLRDRSGLVPRFQAPEQTDTTGYMARMGFFQAAEGLLEFAPPPTRGGGDSSVLLQITPISTNSDVHDVVDRVQTNARNILNKTLNYSLASVVQFSVILSEVCQNILEHAEAPGWVAAQAYNWKHRLGRHVLIISVMDMGRGFRGSLAPEHSAHYGERWGDGAALEAAFLKGLTRFPDSHRGQGIQQIRKQVRRWDGAISIRSGTARIADVPEWDDSPPLQGDLEPFPGAQIHMILPARVTEEAAAAQTGGGRR